LQFLQNVAFKTNLILVKKRPLFLGTDEHKSKSGMDESKLPLTTAQATMMAGTFLAIIRQPSELERCSNSLRIFDSGLEFSGGEVTSWGVLRFFGQFYLALGVNPNEPFVWLKVSLESRLSFEI